MPNSLTQSVGRASWARFQGLFLLAAFVAIFVTFLSVNSANPTDPVGNGLGSLLLVNFLLIAVITILFIRRYLDLRVGTHPVGGRRLARRFIIMFGVATLVPAGIVAAFLILTVTRGFDVWFSDRIESLIQDTAQVSSENFASIENVFEGETLLMAADLKNAEEGLRTNDPRMPEYLGQQVTYRKFAMAWIVSESGFPVLAAELEGSPAFIPFDNETIAEMNTQNVHKTLYERAGLITGLIKLDVEGDLYLYVAAQVDPQNLARLRELETALSEFENARTSSGRLRWVFAIGYAQIAALMVLLSARFALEAATQITGPVGRLARAAHIVSDGDLTVHVTPPDTGDELEALTHSFNTMTAQLGGQRKDLISAREESDLRRIFLETLLKEVSAGVIRTDAAMKITLANVSAQNLLGFEEDATGQDLSAIAPDFEKFARQSLGAGKHVDTSLDIRGRTGLRHFHLKTVRDESGGCILTFDDMTRLVGAQRHLAWRDVARRIAHEIRNPLTPIQLSTERLSRRYSKSYVDDPVFDRCLETILRQVGDIGRMVEEFSNFARMPKPSIANFDMLGLVERICFAQSMVSPDIDISVTSEGEDGYYPGDQRMIGQALGNLVKNAAEAISGQAEETDRQGKIEMTLIRNDKAIDIQIEDNGPGFPLEQRHHLLEPYVTTREKGTGLGLAIVNRIIMDHGGSLTLDNRSDGSQGGCVRVHLPLHDRDVLGVEHSGDKVIDAVFMPTQTVLKADN